MTNSVKKFICDGLSLLRISFSFTIPLVSCDKFCKKISPAAVFRRSYISISFMISLFICVWLLQIKFCLPRAFIAPVGYFNFVHDSINYLYATVTNSVKKFPCGGLSPLLDFNSVHDFINYLCTTVINSVKKFRLLRSFVAPIFQFRSWFHYKFCKKIHMRRAFVLLIWKCLLPMLVDEGYIWKNGL